MVGYTVDDHLQRKIAQKIFKSKIEACLVNAGHYMAFKHRISFATDLVAIQPANFDCDRFRIMLDIALKLLRAAIWSRCALLFESEQTPFPRAGRRFRSAALHRIRFGTCGFVPMSYLYTQRPMNSQNDRKIEWSDERGFGWQQLLAKFHRRWYSISSRKFHFTLKKGTQARRGLIFTKH